MRKTTIQISAVMLVASAEGALAATHFVDLNSTNATPPYANWATAATNIQDAVNAAASRDEILVTNGTYAGEVSINKPLTVRSVSGPQFTTISGGGPCVSLASNAKLCGFTLNLGYLVGNGAGVLGESQTAVVSNCLISANSAVSDGFSEPYGGGGASFSTLSNCIVCFNFATNRPNFDPGTTLDHCCTTPQPTNGIGNITNAPLFLYTNGWANLRLRSNSPCINAGNNVYAAAGPDLDGNPRIVGGTVDIGAYEYQSLSLLNFSVVSNQAGFNITGQSNQIVIVETSADLANWSPLATNTLNGHPLPFSDPVPRTQPRRFYRAQAP